MLLQGLIFLAGLILLYLGAEWLIRGAASLALEYGIRRLVVGITVVALGTSMPEFVVNFFAALSQQDSLALGNIVGSNICNVGLILGMSAIVVPLSVSPVTLRKEYPIMLGVMVLFYAISIDGLISKLDGALLLLGLVAFLVFLVLDARRTARKAFEDIPDVERDPVTTPVWKKVVLVLGGMLFLTGGARLMVTAAVEVADQLGIDHVVIGLTVVAIGTSLPELAASVVGALRDEADMSVGNVLGSNLLNVLFVVGLVAMIKPLSVETSAISLHFPVMIGFSVLLLPLAWTSFRITRLEGGVLIAAFVSYLVYIVTPYL